jgi:hypothetical protein
MFKHEEDWITRDRRAQRNNTIALWFLGIMFVVCAMLSVAAFIWAAHG